MIEGPYFALVVLGAVWCGVSSGVFIAFSTFVMRGLGALPAAQAIAAMNAINIAALAPPFMVVFLGAAVLCAVIAVVTFVLWPEAGDRRAAARLRAVPGGHLRRDGAGERAAQRGARRPLRRRGVREQRRAVADVSRRVGAVEPRTGRDGRRRLGPVRARSDLSSGGPRPPDVS